MTVDERIQAYLDGVLSVEETARFERDLANPEVARLFGEELFLRELMRDLGPEVPAGLAERITAQLPLAHHERPSRLGRVRAVLTGADLVARSRQALGGVTDVDWVVNSRAALEGAGWMVRGPSIAFTGGPGMVGGREALSGVRAALGPLAPAPRPAAPPKKRKPLWRRAIGWMRR
jgi:hypothetical protein